MGNESRLPLYWERQENTSVLIMRREDWQSVVGSLGTPVRFDVRSTPMAAMADVSSVLGSIVHQIGSASARFTVYRYDAQDMPTPINQDDFTVWTDLYAHPKLTGMIAASSTPNDEKLKNFCREHVFFVKQKPGPDHWRPTISSSVMLVLNSVSK